MGFEEWKVSFGLVEGFIAKEIVVATLRMLHSNNEADEESENLGQALKNQKRPKESNMFNPSVAFSLMVFVFLYIP